jgi:hypothetical protein
MSSELQEPDDALADPAELLAGYLDYYRAVIVGKLEGMAEADLRRSVLPSGWSPLELLKHLTYVERRWFQWGFVAQQVDDPWGDNGPDGRWRVGEDETVDDLVAAFRAQAEVSRSVAASARLSDLAALGGRFQPGGPHRPTLAWTMFHVLQEYARHAGHLDVARELVDGVVGE